MLSPTATTIRLFLHALAAAVWVGGQLTLAGLVPAIRASSPATLKPVAHAFARLAWPAFIVLVLTGAWSLAAVDIGDTSTAYQATVLVKIVLAIAAGAATAVHSIGHTKLAIALGGAIGLLASLGAMFLGLLLQTGQG
jgi:putative copper export protein